VGMALRVRLRRRTIANTVYQRDEVIERYCYNFSVNPRYLDTLTENGALVSSGIDLNGEVRIVEMPDHAFFVGGSIRASITTHGVNSAPLRKRVFAGSFSTSNR
jgi:CTP synthase (UTP-ammonia lyase)